MQDVIGFIANTIVEYFISFVWWLVLFPVVWLVYLPFILILALFRRQKYGFAVMDMFVSVHGFWRDWNLV
jgi:hypothetical protein